MTREELIDLYCQDWKETSLPWRKWEYFTRNGDVKTCDKTPDFHSPIVYRRKPDTITGNGEDVKTCDGAPI